MKTVYTKRSNAVWTICAIAIMVCIVLLSSQTASQSDRLSLDFVRKLLILLGSSADAQAYNHFVRKAAHYMLYFLLGLCLMGALQDKPRTPMLIATVLSSAAFAALDELHQHFVEGRGPQVTDVLLDTAGAATGALVMTIILWLLYRNTEKY